MKQRIKTFSRGAINSLVGVAGFELRRKHRWDDPRTFIPFEETLRWAREAGLSVGDYIDATHNVPGATQNTIDQMASCGVFEIEIERVCEIGPGSGRYLEKTLQACDPAYYEIYETASDWAKWLVQRYKVVYQPTDGTSLNSTRTSSIDLVQAHKVFPAMPFLTTMRYFLEMVRVVRGGGKLVFDLLTEECVAGPILRDWVEAEIPSSPYPNLIPKPYVLDFFCKRGFLLDGSFFIPMKPGITEYLIFTKQMTC